MRKERKNLKYGIIALFSLMLLIPSGVSASGAPNAQARYWEGNIIDGLYTLDDGEEEPYESNSFQVKYNGSTVRAYCPDPGLTMGTSWRSVYCSDDNLNNQQRNALMYLYDHATGSRGIASWQFMLGIRFLAIQMGFASADINTYPVARNNYQMEDELRIIAQNAREAIRHKNSYEYGWTPTVQTSTQTSAATISLKDPTRNEDGSYTIEIDTQLDLNSINFTCNECDSITKNANTVRVVLKENECKFTLKASVGTTGTTSDDVQRYRRKRPVLCTTGDGIQNMVIFTDLMFEETPQASRTYTVGTCGPETPDEPTEEPNRCTEKTRITAPTYCDDAENKEILIEAPDNVKYCILNSQDEAGNSYEMLDGEVDQDNPYCSVYCKEDYQMTMPGAQYTTSGQFFSLQNTVVKATRSCYSTEIKINDYVRDVQAAQRELVAAQNAVNQALKEQEMANNNATRHNTTCERDGNTYTTSYYTIDSTSYTMYSIPNSAEGCNPRTGVCSVNSTTGRTDSHSWGNHYEEIGDNPCTLVNDPNPIGSELAAAQSRLDTAKRNYQNVLKHIKQCYNWNNNLCMDTEVSFDYNEQYNTNINYELVSGGGTFTGTEATYATTSIDNEYNNTYAVSNLESPNYAKCENNSCTNEAIDFKISTLNTNYHYRKVEVTGTAEYNNNQSFATNYPSGLIDTVTDRSQLRYNYSYLGAIFPIALNTTRGVYQWDLNFTNLGQYNNVSQCGNNSNGRLNQVLDELGQTAGAGVDYVCVYVVNCPDCDYECVGEGCLIPDEPSCPECDFYCVDCIFDGYSTSFYRLISVDDINPENRTMGANWTTEKGERTKQEIEQNGDSVYINPVAEFKLTPEDMKRIRDYNRDKDTYVAEDLEFHSLNGVANAYGTSKFIDDGEENGYFTLIKRPSSDSWVLWDGTGDNVGPAWKVG